MDKMAYNSSAENLLQELKADCCHDNSIFVYYCLHPIDPARWFISQKSEQGTLRKIQNLLFKRKKHVFTLPWFNFFLLLLCYKNANHLLSS